MAVAVPRTVPVAGMARSRVAAPALRALLFVAVAAAYALVGTRLVAGLDATDPDALARLARAYLVWHGEPARLAALGFGAPPLPGLALLPLAVVRPLASSLVALPVVGGLCGAVTVLALDRALATAGLRGGGRACVVALVALNPVVAYQFTTGRPAAPALALLALALAGLAAWAASADARGLLGAGVAFGALVLCRYELIAWAAVAAALVAGALAARGAGREEAEGSTTAFAAPAAAALAVWSLLAAAIVDDPVGWARDAWDAGAGAGAGLDGAAALGHALELAALPALALPVLLLAAVRRRDAFAVGLAALLVTGTAVAALHAYAGDATGPLHLELGALLLLVAVVGAVWARAPWPLVAAVLAVAAVGAWVALEHYPYATGERAWARALRTGDDQGTTAAARTVGRAVPAGARVLIDGDAVAAPVLLAHRPVTFVTRGRADYVLAARGDALDRAHPGLADGTAQGLVVIAAAGPYVLARVL